MKFKRLKQQTNTVTAYLREGSISPGCNRVEITNTIATMTGTGADNDVTFMQTVPSAQFNGFLDKAKINGNAATQYFIQYFIDVGGNPFEIGCCSL